MDFIIVNATRILQTKKRLKQPKKDLTKQISQATPSASKPRKVSHSMTNLTKEKEKRVTRSK